MDDEITPPPRQRHPTDDDMRRVISRPDVVVCHDNEAPRTRRFLYVGYTSTGVVLEVIAVRLDSGGLLVIHAMPLRRKHQHLIQPRTT